MGAIAWELSLCCLAWELSFGKCHLGNFACTRPFSSLIFTFGTSTFDLSFRTFAWELTYRMIRRDGTAARYLSLDSFRLGLLLGSLELSGEIFRLAFRL